MKYSRPYDTPEIYKMLLEIVVEIIEKRRHQKELTKQIIKHVSKADCGNPLLHYHSDLYADPNDFERSCTDFLDYLNFLLERGIAPSNEQVNLFYTLRFIKPGRWNAFYVDDY
jgi:hypothetical protein